MAVGYGTNPNVHPAAERWNGSAWKLATPTGGATLHDVSCISSSKCFAVGQRVASNGNRLPVLLRWTGTGWTSVSLSLPSATYMNLDGIDCATSTSCLAVGGRSNGSGTPFRTLVYRYNGSGWSRPSSPSPTTSGNGSRFSAVSCVTGTDCFVAGAAGNSTLVERWRGGTTWHRVTTPNPRAYNNLRGISCVSATSCTAVGDVTTNSFAMNAVALRFNGSSWSTKVFAAGNSSLRDVSCSSSAVCMAVGNKGQATLAPRHTSSGWSTTSPPAPGSSYNYLHGIDCLSGGSCRSVGSYGNSDAASRTLTARWS
jgi:hypothetical protein